METLYLKFKGSRSYLHGSDIYNVVSEKLMERFDGYIARLVFRHFARHQIELLQDKPTDMANVVGSGAWQTSEGRSLQFWLRETSQPVTESYPFDEDAISTPAVIQGTVICGNRSNPYSLIENIIALTKKLNYALSPNVEGKWVFGQLNINTKPPTEWSIIEITRTVSVGSSFSRNSISIDGTAYGEIRFVGGNP